MPAVKRVATVVSIQLQAGQTNMGKAGQALGPHGVNIVEVVRAHNTATETQRGQMVPAVITAGRPEQGCSAARLRRVERPRRTGGSRHGETMLLHDRVAHCDLPPSTTPSATLRAQPGTWAAARQRFVEGRTLIVARTA